ncbi:glycerophosphodiester phosphodiesterase family protein [Nonomuraea fastidiosa]|jgi:glycerophosphoryl diester phosphodiesterase|uniref:glycerophosphodiester phosphodiesterase family protein n=1 Tax=Nonomuraea TaxID=83681 RepID=UPI00324C6616
MTIMKKAALLTTLAALGTTLAAPAAHARPAAVACPEVFGHGGYPTGPNPWDRDQIRQPNHARGIDDQKAWGADGVEGDVQVTRQGTKAVMWHNTTTNGLTGTRKNITDLWWAAGSDNLRDRSISRGPYKGQKVHTLRQWLDHVKSRGMIALLEIKPEARPVLSDPTYGAQAWKEVSDPIKERQASMRILVYSNDSWIQSELAKRHPGLLKGSQARWTDSVGWEEPPPSWTGNTARWTEVLAQAPKSVMTNYTKEYRAWLQGKCT